MFEQQKSGFFHTYDLTKPQKQPKAPAAHQHEALGKLHTAVLNWMEHNNSSSHLPSPHPTPCLNRGYSTQKTL